MILVIVHEPPVDNEAPDRIGEGIKKIVPLFFFSSKMFFMLKKRPALAGFC